MWESDPTGIGRLTLRECIYDQILWGARVRLRREQAFFMASIRRFADRNARLFMPTLNSRRTAIRNH
ncbi:hypothetical protein M3A49_28335 [Paraburkholderia sp. CNPSo 3076]|uniref:hypothetical protein n=1 Tax=Paraburkholderia sp. CNPSo 3076 TaxID=2940936 RepID=UPI0022521E4F|nr:hypothetical protein [Paraburkholderia sp. CNPSo 3076]MCX5543352.1 hypothetical protein [Paraburkholderia sp. CNPSo 3076]